MHNAHADTAAKAANVARGPEFWNLHRRVLTFYNQQDVLRKQLLEYQQTISCIAKKSAFGRTDVMGPRIPGTVKGSGDGCVDYVRMQYERFRMLQADKTCRIPSYNVQLA